MADQRLRTEWRQTASLIAASWELHRNPKVRSKRYSADDFDPFAAERRGEELRGSIECLRMFVLSKDGNAPGPEER